MFFNNNTIEGHKVNK